MNDAEDLSAPWPTASARLLILIAAALVVGLVTAGVFKAAVEAALPSSEALQTLLRFSLVDPASDSDPTAAFTWDLARAWRRYLLLVAVALFIVFRKWVPLRLLVARGFRAAERPVFDAGSGALIALGTLIGYWILLVASGFATWAPRPATYLESKIPSFVLAALLIGLAEETFFRGIVFRAMLRDWGVCRALTTSSLLYALLHCLSGTMHVSPGWQPWVGGRLFRALLFGADGSIVPDLRLVMGLFLIGWLFGWLYLRTGSLWAPIGLHSGLTLFSKVAKKLMARAEDYPQWLFGDTVFMVSGVIAWLALLAILLAVPWITRKGPLARRMARKAA